MPDTPGQGFVQGALAAAVAVGVPIVLTMLFEAGLRSLMVTGPMTLGICLISGCGLALWRAIQGWAYRKFKEGPDF